ncbi:MAG: hypothetical protein ACREI9_03440 [Nitrospiraceae bacterium]
MLSRHFAFLSLAIFLGLASPLITHSDTKVLTAEATYTMGDGETPSFAEAMALQKAKQMALEQAGTYVESYTKVQNYTLTADEIQTIAGGVLQVEVLEKKRELIGDGMRHYVKIKATVTTDKIADLAQRIKGKNVAEEYKKLQEDYARLGKEIETWKQLIAKTPTGPERETALDQIREREKAFAVVQKNEATLFKRLVSGEALVSRAKKERETVDTLLKKIAEQGILVKIGEPTSHLLANDPGRTKIRMPVTLQSNRAIIQSIEETARTLGGKTWVAEYERSGGTVRRQLLGVVIRMGKDVNLAHYFQGEIRALSFVLNVQLENGEEWSCKDWHENESLTHPLYSETNPIAALIGIFKRFSDSSPEDIPQKLNRRDVLDRLGEKETSMGVRLPVLWVAKDTFLVVDSAIRKTHSQAVDQLPPASRSKGKFLSLESDRDRSIGFKLDHDGTMLGFYVLPHLFQRSDQEALVIAFDEVRNLTITTEIPISAARQIRAIYGEFKFLKPSLPVERKTIDCSIEP